MTTREQEAEYLKYFAARAPEEIPHWFNHIPLSKDGVPPRPKWTDIEDPVLQKQARDWMFDMSYDLDSPLDTFQEQVETHDAAYSAWEKSNLETRYFQWRWHYAMTMTRGLMHEFT